MVRALARAGVRVLVLDSNVDQPGAHSRYGELRRVKSMHGHDLIEALLELRRSERFEDCQPVLMLTNDRMVQDVAQNWAALEGSYRLSWSHCRGQLAPLLDKSSIEVRCSERGIRYPTSMIIDGQTEVEQIETRLGWPIIVKPTRPLSGFKTYLPENADALRGLIAQYWNDLPFLAQTWIPGDDTVIQFGALLLDRGKVLGHFEGRKIRSRPMGHTTIAEGLPDPEVRALTERFFDDLELSGPVSLELKRDPQGRFWVIEPTVGRTDFWVGLCIDNGFNLPLLEYSHQSGLPLPQSVVGKDTIWFNEERDPLGRLWLLLTRPASVRYGASFLYASVDDYRPFLIYLRQTTCSLMRRSIAKGRKLFGFREADASR